MRQPWHSVASPNGETVDVLLLSALSLLPVVAFVLIMPCQWCNSWTDAETYENVFLDWYLCDACDAIRDELPEGPAKHALSLSGLLLVREWCIRRDRKRRQTDAEDDALKRCRDSE